MIPSGSGCPVRRSKVLFPIDSAGNPKITTVYPIAACGIRAQGVLMMRVLSLVATSLLGLTLAGVSAGADRPKRVPNPKPAPGPGLLPPQPGPMPKPGQPPGSGGKVESVSGRPGGTASRPPHSPAPTSTKSVYALLS